MSAPVYILGAGGFGREVLSWLKQCPDHGSKWHVAGFLDDNPAALSTARACAPLVGALRDFEPPAGSLLVCAIGNSAVRLKVCAQLEARGGRFLTLVHPDAIIGEECEIGDGSIICPGVVITANVRLGRHVIVNAQTTIGHDAVLGDGVTLSGHVDITGYVQVGEGAFFGSHAAALPGSVIGAYAKVGAGSVVLKSVKSHATVMGVPAKQISP